MTETVNWLEVVPAIAAIFTLGWIAGRVHLRWHDRSLSSEAMGMILRRDETRETGLLVKRRSQ